MRGFRLAGNRDDDLEDEQLAPSSRVGADLRAARERLGWTLPDLAAHLRIRLPFLQAIEEGRIGALPGNAYAVGFLRTYAQAVGLDPDEIARRFRAEAADVNRKTELTFPAPVPERGIPAGALILLGVLLVVGAYIGWYRMSGNSRPAPEPVAEVPARLAPLAETKPLPAPEAPRPPPPALADAPMPSPALAPAPPLAAPPPSPPPVPAAQFGPPAPGSEPLPDGTRIVIRAKQDVWMQVREKGGPILLSRVMRAGETFPVPPKPPLVLTTGNAGRTEILVDGAPVPPLGIDGMQRRDVPLDPDPLRNPVVRR